MELTDEEASVRKKPLVNAAQSFRLGEEHMNRLRTLSAKADIPQVDVLRVLIDREFNAMQKRRKRQ